MRIQIVFTFLICGFLFLSFSLSGIAAESSGPVQAVGALAQRVLGGDAKRFVFDLIPADESQGESRDVFELESKDNGQIMIRGNNGVAMASGLKHYLCEYCGCHISHRTQRLSLPEKLPKISETVRVVTPHKYRYYFNYCCFSYSLAWWDWNDWERMIDFMALNGINAPLSVTGQEGVWRNVGRRIGLSDEEIKQFCVGPAFLPFGWMGCIDGWAGPLTDRWIDEHIELEKKILERQRLFGMKPILQGFTGHAPKQLQRIKPDLKMVELTPWCNFPPTWFIDPMDPYFAEFGRIFVEEQTKLFGTDHLYASDTFIEMPPKNNDPKFLSEMGKSIYKGMHDADPEAIWVLQGWLFVNAPNFWQKPQRDAFLRAVPQDSLLLIDLYCENIPVWQKTEAFCGQPWVWCIIQNYGGHVSLHGNLEFAAENLRTALAQKGAEAGKMSGIGYIMEGLGYNPVMDELVHDMIWRKEVPEIDGWFEKYLCRRYGTLDDPVRDAWTELRKKAYREPLRTEYPLLHRPALAMQTPDLRRDTLAAWELLLKAPERLGAVDTFRFDLVNVTRETLASLSSLYYLQLLDAFQRNDRQALKEAADRLETLFLDIDRILATHREFLLGPYLESARRWARTDEEKKFYEGNARTLITLWGPVDSPLDDYAFRQWSGILSDYTVKRWRLFYQSLDDALLKKEEIDFWELDRKIRKFQWDWTNRQDDFPTDTSGENTVAVAKELYEKYKAEFTSDSAMHRRLAETNRYIAPDLSAYPPEKNITTGKPIIASDTLPGYPVTWINDGIRNKPFDYWASNTPAPWVRIDLEEPAELASVVVVCYYGDQRYYAFKLEGSLDGENWTTLADRRANFNLATIDGYECRFEPQKLRYLRVTITGNSANIGRHLVEILAFPPEK